MHSRAGRRLRASAIGIGAAALVAAAPAAAATSKPGATTGPPSSIGQTTVTFTGSVNPHGAATTYEFEYGTTKAYGAKTAAKPLGSGTSVKHVADAVSGLTPFTKYHFRIVATNAKGSTLGGDRTFTTQRQPLTLSMGILPKTTVRWGRDVVVGGKLSGTGSGGQQVVIQSSPFPYTSAFQPIGNALVTSATGTFGYPVPNVSTNTQFRVQMPQKPNVVSPAVTLLVKERVTIHVNRHHVKRRHKVRFSGSITPAHDGTTLLIQRHTAAGWKTVKTTVARHRAAGSRSPYHRHVRIRHGGRYRVKALVSGSNVPGASSTKHLHVHH
jgi:hypothetical protein